MITADYIVVGSGLTGAVIARQLHDAGRDVIVLERRQSVGGNVADTVHEPTGIRIGKHGPHYFRTNSDRIWDYVQRFAPFYKYEARVQARVHGKLKVWPLHAQEAGWPAHTGVPTNFAESCLARMSATAYDGFIHNYTAKQWGVHPSTLSVELANRVNVRQDNDDRFSQHKYQGLPTGGYTEWIESMLREIPFKCGFDYLKDNRQVKARRLLIFTGPIDAFFWYVYGKLKYRGQQRQQVYLPQVQHFIQDCGQVNNCQDNGTWLRSLEWGHMMEYPNANKGTVLTVETPYTPEDSDAYEYPFPDRENQDLYKRYRQRANALDNVLITGRLGEYKYMDMDFACGRALAHSKKILSKERIALPC